MLDLDDTFSDLYGNCGIIDWRPLGQDTLLIDRIYDKEPGCLSL